MESLEGFNLVAHIYNNIVSSQRPTGTYGVRTRSSALLLSHSCPESKVLYYSGVHVARSSKSVSRKLTDQLLLMLPS